MAITKTPFINGVSLSYPLGIFPELFAVLGARTKRSFFEELNRLEGKGGEGLTPEQTVSLFRVGLLTDIPDVTYERAEELVQDYLTEFGDEELSIKFVDALVDAGLNNREIVDKRRKEIQRRRDLLEELDQVQEAKNHAIIQQAWDEVDKLNSKLNKVSEEIIQSVEAETNQPEEVASKPAKRDPLDRKTKKN